MGGGGGEVYSHCIRVVRLSLFCGCEEFVEDVDDGSSEMAEAFCRAEACKGRNVDGAHVAGGFRGIVVCSGSSGGLLEKVSAEVFREVCGDAFNRDRCGPRSFSVGKKE